MNVVSTEKSLFQLSMYWKIVYGFLRLVLGLLLLKVINAPITEVFSRLMQYELVEDPNDFLFHTINSFLGHFSFTITTFIALYLIFWGVIDILLSTQLLRHKLWAFPVSMCVISLFILYEIYRYFHTYSYALLAFIAIDILIVWLIKEEYRRLIHSRLVPTVV